MKPATLAPAYCSLYPALCEVAREHGYALCVHGTLARDMDLLAVAWTEDAVSPTELITAIVAKLDGRMGQVARSNGDGTFTEQSAWLPSQKPHRRLAYSIRLRDFAWNGTNPFIDISVIPPTTSAPIPSVCAFCGKTEAEHGDVTTVLGVVGRLCPGATSQFWTTGTIASVTGETGD